jgi:hypothetical protein
LTLEGIAKEEAKAVDEAKGTFGDDDEGRELEANHIRSIQGWFDEMRIAAAHLAFVGLVTRLHQWDLALARVKQVKTSDYLPNILEALNKNVGEDPPVGVAFFVGLVDARDSIIHNDSKAHWEDPRGRQREVPKTYQRYGELEITEDQLNEAIGKTVEQVRWYAEKLGSPESERILERGRVGLTNRPQISMRSRKLSSATCVRTASTSFR